jgi:hypothetical protein
MSVNVARSARVVPKRKHHRVRTFLLFLIVLIVVIVVLAAVFASSTGSPSYKVSEVSVLALSSSAIDLDFNVTNDGGATGGPASSISIARPGNVNSRRTVLLSEVKPTDVDIALNYKVAIRDQFANKTKTPDVAISRAKLAQPRREGP